MAVNDRSLFQTETHGRPTFLGGLRLRRLFYISALKTNPLERWLMAVVWGGQRSGWEGGKEGGKEGKKRKRRGENARARARVSTFTQACVRVLFSQLSSSASAHECTRCT